MKYYIGPRVKFDTSSLGFGQVKSGGTVTRILNVINDSDVNTAFQVSFICYESVVLSLTACY
jgi:hypothetical protein